jgi:hypothetical protein
MRFTASVRSMRAAVFLCVLALLCAPAVAGAQTPTVPPVATTPPAGVATTPVAPTTTATTTATTVTTATTPQSIEINAPGDSGSDTSPAVVGLIVALALAVLVLLAWALLRLTAWEPSWLPRLRHAVGEAGYRFGGGWAQFRDWFSPRHR